MKPSTAYLIGGMISLLSVAVGVYYLIPGVDHLLATPPLAPHVKHALFFFGLAIVALLGARFAANASRGAA